MAITSGGGATVSDGSSGWVSPGNGTAVQPQHVCPNCGACPHCGRGGYRTYPYPYYTQPWWGIYPPMPPYYVGDWPTYTTITCDAGVVTAGAAGGNALSYQMVTV